MKKRTKIIIAAIAAVLLLVACGLWAYFGQTVSLAGVLPQDGWLDVSLTAVVFEEGQTRHLSYLDEQTVTETLKQTLCTAQAERTIPFDDMRADLLWIVILTGEGHDMWNLSIGENGLLRITSPDYRTYYFENCQDLYLQLQSIAQTLPRTES